MVKTALPAGRRRAVDYDLLPNLILMAYDGVVINRRLNDIRDIEALVEMMCVTLLGSKKPL